ncbi:hypothetical protein [Terricaulis sp.]|uniref:hypothetical protein n=1 Tax=Terricaulis sp. TaxID=2768686 RepID=UPI003782E934
MPRTRKTSPSKQKRPSLRTLLAQASALVAVLAIAGPAVADPDPPVISVDGSTADYSGDQHLGIESIGTISVPVVLTTPVTLNIHDLTSAVEPATGRDGVGFRVTGLAVSAPTLTLHTDASVNITVSDARGVSVRGLGANPSAGQAINVTNYGSVTLDTGRPDQSRAVLQHQEATRDFYFNNVERATLGLAALTGADDSAEALAARDSLICQFVGVQIPFGGGCIPLPVDNESFLPLVYAYLYTQQSQLNFWNSPPSPVEVFSRDPALSLSNMAALAAESFGVGGRGGDITIVNYGRLDTVGADGVGIFAQSVATPAGSPFMGGAVGVENHGAITTGGASAAAISARSVGADSSAGGGAGGLVTITGDGALTTTGDYAFGIYAASIGGLGTTNQDIGGHGGDVEILYAGDIATAGDYASGVYAVSIGGAGAKGKDADAGSGGSNQQANPGARAGDGGAVEITIDTASTVSTTGDYASGVVAVSQGGEGGRGGSGNLVHDASWGGQGGDGGAATATNLGNITTGGHDAYGMLVQSLAGDGGAGGNDSGWFADHGGAGGAAGGGFTVIATNWGLIETLGARSYGILAQSIGGRGGAGGDASSWFGANPGRGGTAGTSECQDNLDCPNGGLVTVDNYGVIVTDGFGAYAVLAQSIGGGGGQGGDGSGWLGIAGGEGGDAGRGDTVSVSNYGWMETHGDRAGAIVAQSIGGGGGNGGDAFAAGPYAALAIGGAAGAGGAGYDVHVRNEGVILITGERSNAILAQSIGGGGGVGGSATAFSVSGAAASIAIGGRGGGGGSADVVEVLNLGDIVTYGDFSNGIIAQSIGGGGGVGGSAYAFAVGVGVEDFALAASVSVGGSGGDGGQGGNVSVENSGSITTFDFNSIGIIAQSIGGGGGQGGASTAQAITTMAGEGVTFTMSFAVGGSGGEGADAGQHVDVVNSGAIFTFGDGSTGILAQSIGGGGGNGGDASTTTAAFSAGESSSLELNIAIGGSGGDGGDGSIVNVTNYGAIVTLGGMANGITAQSIGGGGGTGGAGDQSDLFEDVDFPTEPPDFGDGDDSAGDRRRTRDQFEQLQGQARNAPATQGSHGRTGRSNSRGGSQTVSIDLGISIGGDGGGGGDADTVTVRNYGAIRTGGFMSSGVFAQSVGGGGGVGGGGTGSADGDVGLGAGLGGDATGGGDGGQVFVYNTGSIATLQAMSYGVFAQSIGGGGGLAGVGSGEGDVQSGVNLSLGMGGDGGEGGIGQLVHVEQTGNIVTLGYASIGVFAQSVGGGGGVGGAAENGTFASIGIGGGGGTANNGGPVEVILNGNIATEGDYAHGVFAQSVGGGGGLAGGVDTRTFSFGVDSFGQLTIDTGMTLSVGNFGIGGGGGAGGDGLDVTVISDGDISTFGDGAHGVFAQSIGGGGGAGGSGGATFPLALGLAGSNGDGGAAGAVTVTHTGDIRAWGDNSAGIYAQSMDGSGTGRGGVITITLNGGDVQGGSGDAGVGIFLSGGAGNLIENRGGHISALSGIAIAATDGDDRVLNSGWISGSVGLGAGFNIFDNQRSGLFDAGEGVYLGAAGVLTNRGVVSPFAAHETGTTTLVGDYVQTLTGTLRVDVNFNGGPSDRLIVNGVASLAGAIDPVFEHVSDLRAGSFVTVLSADSLSDNGISINGADTLVLDFTSRIVGADLQVGVARVGFDIGGLSAPREELADHFQALWEMGANSGMDPLMDHLASLRDAGAYGDLLGQIYPYGAFSAGAQPVTFSQTLLNGMMSCPGAAGGADLREHACTWVRTSQLIANQDATALTPAYQSRTRTLMGGAQAEFAPEWFGGFSLAIAAGDYDSDGYAHGASNSYALGAVLKRQLGDLLLSGGVEYARIEGDTVRTTGFPTLVDAASSSDSDILAARFRASYTARFGEFYLRPSLDLDSYQLHTGAFSEAGAGALNLHVRDSEQNITGVGGVLEAGFLYLQPGGTVVHPYLQAGVTQLSEDRLTALANFEGDPVGAPAFRIDSPIPDQTFNVRLGFEALFARSAVRIEYEERNGDSYQDYSFAAKLRVRF